MKRIYLVSMLLVGAFAASMLMSTSAMAATEECVEMIKPNGSTAFIGLWMKSAGRLPDLCEENLAASDGAFELFTFLLAGFLNSGGESLPESNINTSGELELEDNKVPLVGKADVLCSGVLHGLILGSTEPSHLEILSVLSLGGTAINTKALEEAGLECTNIANCPTPLVWAVHLPWLLELELLEDDVLSIFVYLFLSSGAGNPGWEVNCMGNGTSDECTEEEAVAEAKNVTGGEVEGTFSEAGTELDGEKPGTCTLGGAKSGEVLGTGLTKLEGTGTLTVSSLE